ncbi:MAG TPA: ribbon-helix-helix domain-containing protein [Acidobacteriaceae bacterium]|nr:ribbon-helix-helix domain-containing protein [Acidobacteriaceae bacterium]
MDTEADVRWNLKVSRETDLSLRTFLGARGMKKGDLSKFVEEAVRRRIFGLTVQEIKARNASANPEELQRLIDAAVRQVRGERLTERRAGTE